MEQVITFYERLNSDSKHYLDLAGGGDFYYMSPNAVFHMMEELVKECELDEIVVQMVEIETSAENDKSAPHYTNEVRRTSSSENFSAPHSSEVRRTNESNGFSYGKSYVKLEIEVDDEPEQEEDGVAAKEEPREFLSGDLDENVEFEEDDSGNDDLINELYDLIMKDNLDEGVGKIEQEEIEFGLDGLETVSPMDSDVEFDLDKELRELIGEVEGEGAELFGIDTENINSEELEELLDSNDDPGEEENVVKNGLNCLETVSPNKVIEESMVNEAFEVREKQPDLDELHSQGMTDFIDKVVSWLMCRKDESLEKVGKVSFHDREKNCKSFCIQLDYLRRMMIFANTKQWFDAWVKHFYGVFVLNEATIFYDYLRLFDWRTWKEISMGENPSWCVRNKTT